MDKARMLQEFFDLVKITSSTRREREAADFVTARLKELGCTVTEDQTGEKIQGNAGNLIARFPGNRPGVPVVMLSAHLDCVEPCSGIEPVLENGVIRSAGDTILGSDDKAGVAAILEALRVLKESGKEHGDILVVMSVAEEGGLLGAKNIDRTLLQADFGYALDGGGDIGEIVAAAPGQEQLDVTVYGKKAHAGIEPEAGVNAITLAGKALAAMKQGRIDEETTANIGMIQGGVATNIVPDRVELKCEARSLKVDKLTAQVNHMKRVFEETAKAGGGRVEIVTERIYQPYVLAEDSTVIQTAVAAAKTLKLAPKVTVTGGGSDANYYNIYGVPCAVLSVGMTKPHTTEETVKEADLYLAVELILAILSQVTEA